MFNYLNIRMFFLHQALEQHSQSSLTYFNRVCSEMEKLNTPGKPQIKRQADIDHVQL